MSRRKHLPPALLRRIRAVRNKRARFVLETIAEKGSCSTIDLKNAGYDHPPRAARDAVELGFALKRINAKRADGQRVAAYTFDERELDPKMTGRVALSKKERDALIVSKGNCCNICGSTTNLQIDHRIPYGVAGESRKNDADPYQVLDGICNRRKSWACEHCENRLRFRDLNICLTCYWAKPEKYTHVAMRNERRIDLLWIENEVEDYKAVEADAAENGHTIAEQMKFLLKRKP